MNIPQIKKEKIFTKKLINCILSFLSFATFCFGITSSYQTSQFTVYITSYFHSKDPSVNMQCGNLIMPILFTSSSLSNPLGGVLEKKFGVRLSIAISLTLVEIITFIFINQTNILFTYFLMMLLGMSLGLSASIPGKVIYSFYPKQRGILGACMLYVNFLVGGTASIFGEKIINRKKITLKDGETFFPVEISERYLIFYKVALIVIPISTLLTILLIREHDPINDIENKKEISKKNGKIITNNIKNNINKNYKLNVKHAIFHKRIWKIASISILTPFAINYSVGTFRVYGALIGTNGTIMQYFGVLCGISGLVCSPIWGFINDHFKYDIIIRIICLGCIIHNCLLFLFIKFKYIYTLLIFIGPIFTIGFGNIVPLHIIKVYGIKYFIEIGGIVGICGGMYNIFSGFLSFVISKNFSTGNELQQVYKVIFFFGIGISFVGFYFARHENDEAFIYPFEHEDNIVKEKQNNHKKNSMDKEENDLIKGNDHNSN